MSMLPDTDPFPFDDRLRSAYDESATPPPAPSLQMWAGLQPHLHPSVSAPASRRAPLLAGVGGLLLGIVLTVLLSWWGAKPIRRVEPRRPAVAASAAIQSPQSAVSATSASEASVSASAVAAPQAATAALAVAPAAPEAAPTSLKYVTASPAFVRPASAPETAPSASATAVSVSASASTGVAPDSTEAVESPAVPTVLLALVQTETALTALSTDTTRITRERHYAALLTQRTELIRLRARTDSLLLTLGALPETPPALTAAPPADSVAPLPFRRWSVAVAFAPERNFFGLNAPAGDTLSALRRTHEQGRGGYSAAALAEYRLDQRLSVGAGLGVASYGAELRLTEQHTLVSTHFDSSTTTSAHDTTVTTVAYAIHPVPDSILAPILNVNNEVIGYEYLPTTRLDTVWTHLVNTETKSLTKTTYTPTVTTRQETSARILKPNYRFLTVPLLVRYRLGRATDWTSSPTAPRWWADVAVGAQLQWFLGGTQASTRDGLTYHTERVGPRGGPFRPLNVALTGAVAFNYALTPRLSASLAPTLRYQVASVYKASTNLTQKPTATGLQMGLRFAF